MLYFEHAMPIRNFLNTNEFFQFKHMSKHDPLKIIL